MRGVAVRCRARLLGGERGLRTRVAPFRVGVRSVYPRPRAAVPSGLPEFPIIARGSAGATGRHADRSNKLFAASTAAHGTAVLPDELPWIAVAGRTGMLSRSSIGALARAAACLAALSTTIAGAWAFDDSPDPNLKGQRVRAPPPPRA